jgi:FkbM family methyltransferase
VDKNFSLETRFSPEESVAITRLFDAGRDASVRLCGGPAEHGWRQSRLAGKLIREVVRHIPRASYDGRLRDRAVAEFCRAVEELTGRALTLEEGESFMRWTHGPETWLYPRSPEKLFFFGFVTAVGPARWLGAKYTSRGFVELEPGDVVVDCGAFVGGFARAATDAGATVIAVEPSRTNQACLRANLQGSGVDVHPVGLGDASVRQVPFREASTGLDSTFGAIDEGVPTATYGVDVVTIDELSRQCAARPSFVKVEAEGMEIAILEGMKDVRPAKIAVDASPEGGSDDRQEIRALLEQRGYTVREDLKMVYARL